MKVTFNVDSRANIHSCKSHTFDLNTERGQSQFGYTKEEWLNFTDDEKQKIVEEWAMGHIEYYYEETK